MTRERLFVNLTPPAQPISTPRADVPRVIAAVLTVLAVGAALGLGHFVAALIAPASSPFLAVGDSSSPPLGLLGLLAVINGPAFTPVDLAAPAAAPVVGIDAFRRLHVLAIRTYVPAAGGADGPAVSRCLLLVGSSAAVAVVSLAAGGVGQLLGSGPSP